MSAATPATVTPNARELAAMLRSARGLQENSQTLSVLMASPRLARAVLGLFLVGATIASAHFSGGRTREVLRDSACDFAIFRHNAARHPSFSPAGERVRSLESPEEDGMRSLRALAASSVGVGSIIAAGISGSAFAQDAVQWRIEDGGNGHWYAFTESVYGSWKECRIAAETRGATLAQLKTAALQNFIVALAHAKGVFGDYWLGASQQQGSEEPSGGWSWLDGEPLSFDAWGAVSAGTGSPPSPNDWPTSAPGDEDFLEICFRPGVVSPVGSWDDQGAFPNPSLIEWSADCNADGIVDYGQIRAGELADTNANNIPDCCEQGTPCEVNLLVNGGFESGPTQTDCDGVVHPAGSSFIPGWSVVAVSVDRVRLSTACPLEIASWQSFEGEFTVDLDGDAAGGALAQSVATQPGRRYRLTFQLTGNCAPGTKRMRVEIGSLFQQFEHVCVSENPQPWSKQSIEFEATGTSSTIVLRSLLTDGRNGPVIDDVRLVQLEDTCLADIDESGAVNAVDLAAILSNWGTNGGKYPRADINADGIVSAPDLAEVLGAWGPCP